MMTVAELAKKSGVTPDAVRYYTRRGLLRPERDPNNRYRLYNQKEVNWLKFIRQAKTLGFTLHEIQRIMQSREEGYIPCAEVRDILQNNILKNRQHLKELVALQDRMEDALNQWNNIADVDELKDQSICPLIESIIYPEIMF